MTHSEKQYAMKRVDDIVSLKQSHADKKCRIPSITLTNQQKVELIRKGQVKPRPAREIRNSSYNIELKQVFDFSKYERSRGNDDVLYEKLMAPITKKAQQIKDKIMLGNADAALKMILALEAMSPK